VRPSTAVTGVVDGEGDMGETGADSVVERVGEIAVGIGGARIVDRPEDKRKYAMPVTSTTSISPRARNPFHRILVRD